MNRLSKFLTTTTCALLVAVCGLLVTTSANADVARRVLARAEPDACYTPGGPPHAVGTYDEEGSLVSCPEGSVEKTNQTYLWGMAHGETPNGVEVPCALM